MDLIKIGAFLKELRQEHQYTQEQLGDILGVTNKTISRWENGNYMPPVEMLMLLSEHYHISINELLSGERLSAGTYMQKAEQNICDALRSGAFSLKERISFFRKKWLKEHLLLIFVIAALVVTTTICGILVHPLFYIAALIVAFAGYLFIYNRMMAYVEAHAYDGSGS